MLLGIFFVIPSRKSFYLMSVHNFRNSNFSIKCSHLRQYTMCQIDSSYTVETTSYFTGWQVRAIWRQVDKNRTDQVAADQNVSAAPAAQSVPLANSAGQSVPLANLAGQSGCGGAVGNGLHRHTSNVGVTSTGLKNKGTRTDVGPPVFRDCSQ